MTYICKITKQKFKNKKEHSGNCKWHLNQLTEKDKMNYLLEDESDSIFAPIAMIFAIIVAIIIQL